MKHQRWLAHLVGREPRARCACRLLNKCLDTSLQRILLLLLKTKLFVGFLLAKTCIFQYAKNNSKDI